MNLFKTLAMVGLVCVGVVGQCSASAYFPPYPVDLVKKYELIAIVKVTDVTTPITGSILFHDREEPIAALLAQLNASKVLKGTLPKTPLVFQAIGTETLELELNKEYLVFLNRDEWRYTAKIVLEIKQGKVPWYISDTDIKAGTPPPWDDVPVEKAIKSIQGFVKDAGKVNNYPATKNAFKGNGVEIECAPVTEGDVTRQMLNNLNKRSASPTPL